MCVERRPPAAAGKIRRKWPKWPELDINWIFHTTAGVRCRHGEALLFITGCNLHIRSFHRVLARGAPPLLQLTTHTHAHRRHKQQGETPVINYMLTQVSAEVPSRPVRRQTLQRLPQPWKQAAGFWCDGRLPIKGQEH